MKVEEQARHGAALIGTIVLVPIGKFQREVTAYAKARVVSYYTGGALTLVVEPVEGVGQAKIREWAPLSAAEDLIQVPE